MHGAEPTNGLHMGLRAAGPLRAALVLAAFFVLVVAGLSSASSGRSVGPVSASASTDAVLYAAIIDDLTRGAPYYDAAVEAQRRHGFPVRPFVAVRPPSLAVAMAAAPEPVRRGLLIVLAIACIGAWGRRLSELGLGRGHLALSLVALTTGVLPALAGQAYLFHEVWAGLLIALSLALRRPDRWGASVALGLAAALTRELAGAYLLAMAALAWRDGRRGEALAWGGALALLGGALVAHAGMVAALTTATDPASQGWLRFGGWPFVLSAMSWNALFAAAPPVLIAIAAPLALVGLATWRDPLGERVALTVAGYAAAFAVVGRPENNYWGLLIAPLWPLGWLLVPRAVEDIWRGLRVSAYRPLA